jgi:trehalose 6-phosphate phosphatase
MASLKPLWLSVGSLSERLRRADSLHLGLDFDGTLTPLAHDPRETRLTPRARAVLQRLAREPGVHLALLSSRGLDDLCERAGIEGIFYAGSSGLETRDARGRRESHTGPATLPGPLARELESWCGRFPGAVMDTHSHSCTLFFSGIEPTLQPAFGAGVRRRIRPFHGQVELVHGRTGFEVRPEGSWDKSAALAFWLEGAPGSGALFFFGDDRRDEPAHAAARARGGVAVAVDRIVSHAEYGLPGPGDVVWFLEWLEREWHGRGEASAAHPELEASTA